MSWSRTGGLTLEDLAAVSCHGCGLYDASLRLSSHPSVVSMIVKARESSRVGVWCARCRSLESMKAAAITLLAGWWSASGPRLAWNALRANLTGGEQRATANAQLLRGIAQLEIQRGNPELASMFAHAAHEVQPQRENSRLIDDLSRAGHRARLEPSPWRLAPATAVVIMILAIAALAVQFILPHDDEPLAVADAPPAPREQTRTKSKTSSAATRVSLTASASELERHLAPDSEPELARAYLRARLRELQIEIPGRVRRGDDLWSLELSIRDFVKQPALAKVLKQSSVSPAYENLLSAMNESTRYYRGGGPVEALERTAGESLDMTAYIALHAIVSEYEGRTAESSALADEVAQRAESLREIRRELRIRGAVIAHTRKATDDLLATLH